jgi:death-on-curing protein
MRYLDGEEVLVIHAFLIERTGGLHGVRDVGLLKSILEAPRQTFGGRALYPDLWTKAAVYLERFAKYHVFVDGNKRTAIAVAARFLRVNRYEFRADNAAVVHFMVHVIVKRLDVSVIAAWLKRHSKKMR